MSDKPDIKNLKNEIKIIFSDVDETLVVKNEVPECNREAIANLRKKNDIYKDLMPFSPNYDTYYFA